MLSFTKDLQREIKRQNHDIAALKQEVIVNNMSSDELSLPPALPYHNYNLRKRKTFVKEEYSILLQEA